MNYIKLPKNTNIQVESKPNVGLTFALRDSISLARTLRGSVELKHELGTYLIDANGEFLVIEGEDPNRDLLPTIIKLYEKNVV